ncbi:NAD-dependent epimerase/dehydratase family protein [Streptomyces sp. C10-9-1]|uniref:NAD-dependent epimerase/dehydratase family protein n=1 Tax=Streptomyces sp. C10-9-1 TaxID=1859285 RepID=UPI003F4A6195
MRVLLTGAAGFIGRHLHRALATRGDDVVAIDLRPSRQGQWMRGDALDFFREDRSTVDLAIHCAAIVGGRASIDGSPLGVATNLALDSWYMRWLVRNRIPRAVYFSSSAAYPVALQQPGPIHPLTETDIDHAAPSRPDATYGLAKLTGEQLAQYAAADGVRMTVLRPFSGYGADQDPAYPFPAFIGRARARQAPFEVWGDGGSTRDWIHIDDIVAATLTATDEGITGPVNLGTGHATTFEELARLVTTAVGYQPRIRYISTAPQGVYHRVSDPTQMRAFHQPTVPLEEGIRRALAT